MIRENQKLLNRLNVLSDGVLIYMMLPLAYWLRFHVLPGGVASVPLSAYLRVGAVMTLAQLFTYAAFGIYRTTRVIRIRAEAAKLLQASLLDMLALLGWLFLGHAVNFSRWLLAIFFVLSTGAVILKHALVRRGLRELRRRGRNLRHVLVVGGGGSARKYLETIRADRELGYHAVGYIAGRAGAGFSVPYLGGFEALEGVLERTQPDEVISAIEFADYELTPHIIERCEKAGVRLAIIPFYADYMPARPQFDDLGGIPLMNIRRIPLDNFANAFVKRAMDVVGAALMLLLLSPVMAVCAAGVKLTSPGPVLFRQERVGKNKKTFSMLKFRSMRLNDESDTAWSTAQDDRRTRFGAFLRKYSLDELPQLFCVLAGSMSLVGPRPELPFFVDQFREEIPLYMVRHQVRPGMTGWAQIHGYRGDTPIKERVEHDIWYIENWSLWLDIRVLLATVFKGEFVNDEELSLSSGPGKEAVRNR